MIIHMVSNHIRQLFTLPYSASLLCTKFHSILFDLNITLFEQAGLALILTGGLSDQYGVHENLRVNLCGLADFRHVTCMHAYGSTYL